MRHLSGIFWRHSWDVGTLVPNNSGFFVCLSVWQLACILNEIQQILIYGSEIFKTESTWSKGHVPSASNVAVMPGPCLDHVGVMFGLTLCQDYLWLWYFHNWVNLFSSIACISYQLSIHYKEDSNHKLKCDNFKTIFKPFWALN